MKVDSTTKIWVTSKNKHVNVKLFNMISRRNKTKTFSKHISCDFECKLSLNSSACSLTQKWNNDKSISECIKYYVFKKNIIEILTHGLLRMVIILKFSLML